MDRRRCLLAIPAGLGLLGLAPSSRAGAQIEEPLADAVRTALSVAVSPGVGFFKRPDLEFADTDARLAYLRWLGAMSPRLQSKFSDPTERLIFLERAWYESRRAGLDTGLVLGLIQVESNFRKFAVSPAGARGYMQVMPFWARLIGDGDAGKLFHMQTNLRFGCVILRHYIEIERGALFMALGRYNGSRGKSQYPDAVLGAARSWDFHQAPPAERAADPSRPADKVPGGPN